MTSMEAICEFLLLHSPSSAGMISGLILPPQDTIKSGSQKVRNVERDCVSALRCKQLPTAHRMLFICGRRTREPCCGHIARCWVLCVIHGDENSGVAHGNQ